MAKAQRAVCLKTILLNQGLRGGVYSPPHLLRYNERVRIQNQELAG